ncbi:CaiB/BaiF CoA transferase family protein [Thermodesulfobacteriota bacterium]
MNKGLEGIMVVETATVVAGPMAGRLLADWGADVIHVEHPIRGDIGRSMQITPELRAAAGGCSKIVTDINYTMENHNRNKRGITLDLSQSNGQKIIHKLLEKADVFISNYRQRELEKFNLEYHTLNKINPRLISANVSGYGRKGPDKDLPGYDGLAFWARSGFLHAMQTPEIDPFCTPISAGDRICSMALTCGIMTALFIRERTGLGQEADVSLYNTGVFTIAGDIGGTLVTGQDLQQVDRKDLRNALSTFYQTKDNRWLRIGMPQPDLYWSRFCQAIERSDLENDPRFESFIPRIENHVALFNILEEVFATKTLAEWKIRLDETGLPWAPLLNLPEVVADPQARANDFFDSYNHPSYGHIETVANPIKLSKTKQSVRAPAPEFGQHTEEVLLEFGYTWKDIEKFKEEGIIA